MNLYIIGIIFCILIFIGCLIFYLYLKKDENNLLEVSNDYLIRLGKVYSKEEFENQLFTQYANILSSIGFEHYAFLRDAVSDQLYNQILLDEKNLQLAGKKQVIDNIKKEFCKLIAFSLADELEIVKLWVRYTSIEFQTAYRKTMDEEGNEVSEEMVVDGSKDQAITSERILTFVRNKTKNEDVVCPNCGYQTHILTTSNCIRCEQEIVPKRMHWVLVDKVNANIKTNEKKM